MKDIRDESQVVVFQRDGAYRIITANGVWGGLTERGDILVDFFIERPGYPVREETPRTDVEPKTRRLREVQVGILLEADAANTIGHWLIDKARQAAGCERLPHKVFSDHDRREDVMLDYSLALLSEVEPAMAIVFFLREYFGMSFAEIAKRTKTNRKAASRNYAEAIKALRKKYGQIEEDLKGCDDSE